MKWIIPGTVILTETEDTARIEERLRAMFMAGGIVLSQVAGVTGLEPYTIQNWVKRGFLSPPQKKKYTLRQLCRILNINMLKSALPLEDICGLLGYINGQLHDESDDLIDDSELYFLFVRLAAYHRQMNNIQGRDNYLKKILEDYEEPVPGARARVEQVLRIMLTAWAASQLRQTADRMVKELKEQSPQEAKIEN